MKLEWNVYYYNFNKREIQRYNVFNHWRFNEDVAVHLKSCTQKQDFAKKLRRELFYYFCTKYEWEVLVCQYDDKSEVLVCQYGDKSAECALRIDVFDQVMMNWDVFLDYVWSNKTSCHRNDSEKLKE